MPRSLLRPSTTGLCFPIAAPGRLGKGLRPPCSTSTPRCGAHPAAHRRRLLAVASTLQHIVDDFSLWRPPCSTWAARRAAAGGSPCRMVTLQYRRERASQPGQVAVRVSLCLAMLWLLAPVCGERAHHMLRRIDVGRVAGWGERSVRSESSSDPDKSSEQGLNLSRSQD